MVNSQDNQKDHSWGRLFSNEDIGLFLDSIGAVYEYYENEADLIDHVAHLLNQEKLLGGFRGAWSTTTSAWLPQHHRGCPFSRMQQTMNLKIKFRESFRPFAPVFFMNLLTLYSRCGIMRRALICYL